MPFLSNEGPVYEIWKIESLSTYVFIKGIQDKELQKTKIEYNSFNENMLR